MELTTDDRLAIGELCARACHLLDFNDPDGYVGLFLPDGVFQRRASPSAGGEVMFRHQGHGELRAFAEKMSSLRQGLARHWTANLALAPTTDGAAGSSYTMLVATDPEARQVGISIAGTYQDVFAKTGTGWRFVSRTVTDDL